MLCLAAPAQAQSVKLPAEVKGAPTEWVMIVPDAFDGGKPKYFLSEGLERVPIEKMFPGMEPVGVVVKARKDGEYYVYAYNAKGDVASDPAKCKVTIGTPPPPPPPPEPEPQPKPPIPKPPQPQPQPPTPDTLGFVGLARQEALKIPAAQRGLAKGLADNFEAISAQLAATANMTVDEANTNLRDFNRVTLGNSIEAWRPWFIEWQKHMDVHNNAGRSSREHYIQSYSDTARGLRLAIAAAKGSQ